MDSPWPLRDLRITTPELELRFPTATDLDVLAEFAALEGYDPSVPAFAVKDDTPVERSRRLLQRFWVEWGEWKPTNWILNLVVVIDGEPIGHQLAWAAEFGVVREVETGSWIARAHQGRGIGTKMREAMLHFAFAGLDAEYATSSSRQDNPASLAVSRKVGYVDDGLARSERNGEVHMLQRFRLDRATWAARTHEPTEIHDLEPCRPLFGI